MKYSIIALLLTVSACGGSEPPGACKPEPGLWSVTVDRIIQSTCDDSITSAVEDAPPTRFEVNLDATCATETTEDSTTSASGACLIDMRSTVTLGRTDGTMATAYGVDCDDGRRCAMTVEYDLEAD